MTTVVLLLFRKHLRGTWVFKGAALAAVAASLLLTVHDLTGAFAFVEAAPCTPTVSRGSCRQWSAARPAPFWADGSIRPRADESSQKLINCTITMTLLPSIAHESGEGGAITCASFAMVGDKIRGISPNRRKYEAAERPIY